MADRRRVICITCPMGCRLDLLLDPDMAHVLEMEGHACKRAWSYAEKELTSPTRMVTTTVRVRGGIWPLLPVHTASPIGKLAIFLLLQELRRVEVQAPVHCGQVVLANAAGTGVNVLASRDLPAIGEERNER